MSTTYFLENSPRKTVPYVESRFDLTFPISVSGTVTFQLSQDAGGSWLGNDLKSEVPSLSPILANNMVELVNKLNAKNAAQIPPLPAPATTFAEIGHFIEWSSTSNGKRLRATVRDTSKSGPQWMMRPKQLIGDMSNTNLGFSYQAENTDTGQGFVQYPYWLFLPKDKDPFTALSVNLYKQAQFDRDQYLHLGHSVKSNGLNRIRGYCYDGVNVFVEPVSGLVARNASNKPALCKTADQENATQLPTTGLSADTWYYVYINYNGVLSYSTTAPEVRKIYKTGDTTNRYLFPFRSSGASTIIPFDKMGLSYIYFSPQIVVIVGTATAATDVSAAAVIPPTSRSASFRLNLNEFSGALNAVSIGPGGSTLKIAAAVGPDERRTWVFDVATNTAREISYNIFSNAGGSNVNIDVVGFYE